MTVSKAAQIKVTAKTDQAQQELQKLAGAADKVRDKMEDMGKSGQKAGKQMNWEGMISGAKTVALGLGATAYGMDRVVMAGARYSAILQNLPFSIDAATKATQGYIGKTALMDAALLAHRAGIAKTSAEFADFASNVQKVAASRGQDASEAMDVLTRALSRNETELLDNYGVILKVTQAKEIYRKQILATGRAYTDEDDAAAFAKVGMQRLKEIAAQSTTEMDEFTASWVRWKAVVTDVPALVHGARESLYDFMVAMDEWDKKMDRDIAGVAELIGDHRRGVGFRGLAAAINEAHVASIMASQTGKGGMIGEAVAWIAKEFKRGEAIGKITTEKLTAGLETASEQRIFGVKSKGAHKKRAEEIILIYDNVLEEFSERQRLLAMESGALIEQALASRTGTGTLTSDPFAKDPKAEAVAGQELAATQRQLELEAAQAKEDDLAGELDRINREQAARMDFAIFMERTASSELEMMEAKEAQRQAQHDAQLGRIAVEMKAEDKRRARMQQVGGALVGVHQSVAAAAIQGALASGESARGAVKHMAAAKAQEMLILGVTEQIQAIACFAMLNIPQGIAHQTAAGLAFAQAAIFGATYGVLGAGGGGGSRASAPSGGGGGPSATPSNSAGEKPETSIPQGTPISRPSSSAPPPPPMRNMGAGKTTQINVTNYSVLPPDPTEQMLQLRRMLAKSEREDGPT